jgi:hypothetical protein
LLDSLSIPFNGTCFGACFTAGDQFVDAFQANGGLLGPVFEAEPDVVELFAYRISLFPDSSEVFSDLQLVSRNPEIAFSGDRFFLVLDQSPVAVPEPESLAIVIASLGWLAIFASRTTSICSSS